MLSRILQADGARFELPDPCPARSVREVILRHVEAMNELLAASLYGEGPEGRVRRLRASVLGEPEPAADVSGLAAWLPPRP